MKFSTSASTSEAAPIHGARRRTTDVARGHQVRNGMISMPAGRDHKETQSRHTNPTPANDMQQVDA